MPSRTISEKLRPVLKGQINNRWINNHPALEITSYDCHRRQSSNMNCVISAITFFQFEGQHFTMTPNIQKEVSIHDSILLEECIDHL